MDNYKQQRQQARLLEYYSAELKRKSTTPPPEELDAEIAETAGQLHTYLHPPKPRAMFIQELQGQLLVDARIAASRKNNYLYSCTNSVLSWFSSVTYGLLSGNATARFATTLLLIALLIVGSPIREQPQPTIHSNSGLAAPTLTFHSSSLFNAFKMFNADNLSTANNKAWRESAYTTDTELVLARNAVQLTATPAIGKISAFPIGVYVNMIGVYGDMPQEQPVLDNSALRGFYFWPNFQPRYGVSEHKAVGTWSAAFDQHSSSDLWAGNVIGQSDLSKIRDPAYTFPGKTQGQILEYDHTGIIMNSVEDYDTYEVKLGDTLASIAQQDKDDTMTWQLIYEANRYQIRFPDLILPGQVLCVPRFHPAAAPPDTKHVSDDVDGR